MSGIFWVTAYLKSKQLLMSFAGQTGTFEALRRSPIIFISNLSSRSWNVQTVIQMRIRYDIIIMVALTERIAIEMSDFKINLL